MSYLSNYLENELLDHVLGVGAYTRPTSVIFGLFTADPGESGATGEVSSSGTGYARVTVPNNTTNFPQCSTSGTPVKTNGAVIAFPTPTASWGTVTHWAAYDQGGTNMLAHGPLVTPQSYTTGDSPKIPIGGISLSFSVGSEGGLSAYSQRKLLDHVFGYVEFPAPAAVYLAVGTALSGDVLTEWNDSGYARAVITFGAATDGTSANTGAVALGTAATDATLTHYAIFDSSTSGSAISTGVLGTSLGVIAGDTVGITAPSQATIILQ